MVLAFFEDKTLPNFHPLTLTRPADDLRIGIWTIKEKWSFELNAYDHIRLTRPSIRRLYSRSIQHDETVTWVNSLILPEAGLVSMIKELPVNESIISNGRLIASKVDAGTSRTILQSVDIGNLRATPTHEYNLPDEYTLTHLWDLIALNGKEIQTDINRIAPKHIQEHQFNHVWVTNPHDAIFAEEGVQIEPGCSLIATEGPIYIGKNTILEAGTVLRGPVAVCEGAVIKMGSRISGGTTVGPVCKIGGEVTASIFHSYSNKAHDGFVGHSLIGQWCNLGAGTTTSNLKNDYGFVKFPDWETGSIQQTNQQFLGTVMGDHTKTAIQTKLNTGTRCGVSCNIVTSAFPPNYIPSFSWLTDRGIELYRLEKAITVMKAMMARRNIDLTEEYASMIQELYSDR
ncbi:MAG: putative sugar nucleotidyl transferase [Bacteroidota bacterium]